MDACQKIYAVFVENVCKKYNCQEALPILQRGFKSYCEAESEYNNTPAHYVSAVIGGRRFEGTDIRDLINRNKQFLTRAWLLDQLGNDSNIDPAKASTRDLAQAVRKMPSDHDLKTFVQQNASEYRRNILQGDDDIFRAAKQLTTTEPDPSRIVQDSEPEALPETVPVPDRLKADEDLLGSLYGNGGYTILSRNGNPVHDSRAAASF